MMNAKYSVCVAFLVKIKIKMTILDIINEMLKEDSPGTSPAKLSEAQQKPKTWYSFEYFPPKTVAGK